MFIIRRGVIYFLVHFEICFWRTGFRPGGANIYHPSPRFVPARDNPLNYAVRSGCRAHGSARVEGRVKERAEECSVRGLGPIEFP